MRWCCSGSTGCRTPTRSCWATPRTGKVRTILTERDSTWVDLMDDMAWLDQGKNFTWVSERDGWNHVYVISRDGKSVRLVTRGAYDVSEVLGADDREGWLYYIASPEQPAQRYLFRTRLDGKGQPERLSPKRNRELTSTTAHPIFGTPWRPTRASAIRR